MFCYIYIVWKKSKPTEIYLGKRTSKRTPLKDFGKYYFTSSAIIRKEFKSSPFKFDWKIIANAAPENLDDLEYCLLNENREYLALNLNFLKTPTFKGRSHKEISKKKISLSLKKSYQKKRDLGIPFVSEIGKENIRKACESRKQIPWNKDTGLKEERTCEGCGKLFIVPFYSSKIYCDRDCYVQHHIVWNLNSGDLNKICERCGKPFVTKKKEQKYCSKECYLKGDRIKRGRYHKRSEEALLVSSVTTPT